MKPLKLKPRYGPSSAFLMNIFFAFKGSKPFYSYLEKLTKYGYVPISIAIVRQFHDSMQVCVQNDGEDSELFLVTNRVKKGCVMAPTLLSMMFSGTALMTNFST